jgi:hypothetical protein
MRTRVLAAALALGIATPAAAGSLATPMLLKKENESITCTVTNVGTKPVRAVVSELILYENNVGTVAKTTGPADLAPLAMAGVGEALGDGVDQYQCRFTFKGSGKLLRANGVVMTFAYEVLDTQPAY